MFSVDSLVDNRLLVCSSICQLWRFVICRVVKPHRSPNPPMVNVSVSLLLSTIDLCPISPTGLMIFA